MPRLGIEYLTSNQYTAFPFAEDATGLAYGDMEPAHGAEATLPANFLIDAMVSVPAEVNAVFLVSIEALDPTTYQFRFADQDGTIILTYDLDVSSTLSGYTTFLLESAAAGVVLRLMALPAFKEHLETITGLDTYSARLPFEAAALDIRPPKCLTFDLYDQLPPIPAPDTAGPFDGHVTLIEGYNVAFDTETDDEPDTTAMTIAAVPGLGSGRAPCEAITNQPHLSMNLTPDKLGNIRIATDDCYAIEPVPGFGVRIHGSCYACCTCDEYVRVGRAMQRLMDRTHNVHAKLTALHAGGTVGAFEIPEGSSYTEQVTMFNEVRFRSVRKVYLRAAGMRGMAGGSSAWGVINAYVENRTELLLDSIRVTLEGGGDVRSGQMSVHGSSSSIGSLVTIPPLGPQEGAALVWLVAKASGSATVRAYATIDGEETEIRVHVSF